MSFACERLFAKKTFSMWIKQAYFFALYRKRLLHNKKITSAENYLRKELRCINTSMAGDEEKIVGDW
jgi:hypothetical protein